MHALSILFSLAPVALAQTLPTLSQTALPVSDFLADIYGTAIPSGATGAAATSLASAIYSFQTALTTDQNYKSAADAVYNAFATATNADFLATSLDAAGVLNGAYTTESWYQNNVPSSAQSEWASFLSSAHAVETSVLDAVATTTSASAGSGSTGTSSTGSSSATSTVSKAGAQGAKATGMVVAGLAAAVAAGAAVAY